MGRTAEDSVGVARGKIPRPLATVGMTKNDHLRWVDMKGTPNIIPFQDRTKGIDTTPGILCTGTMPIQPLARDMRKEGMRETHTRCNIPMMSGRMEQLPSHTCSEVETQPKKVGKIYRLLLHLWRKGG